jgi:hypothetical protein
MAEPLYDRIGTTYARHRRPDARVAARIGEALGDARAVLDVGAGTGSYEPADREVIAVEPSWVMIGSARRTPHRWCVASPRRCRSRLRRSMPRSRC